MTHKIVSIGFDFGLDDVEDVDLTSNVALADADIVFFTPCFDAYFSEDNVFSSGERYMNAESAARLRHSIQHWRTELIHAVNAGKTVICLFESPKQFRVRNGSHLLWDG